ncbi:hypothetical protein [Desulfosporosinus orientis]|uniref:hypothetical protein n=1 Tax=Desulfosporosinus orientis TaxID=1563 RepID=UPI001390C56E|nr:hypothetical protein [Desulfosporosinus orientis]
MLKPVRPLTIKRKYFQGILNPDLLENVKRIEKKIKLKVGAKIAILKAFIPRLLNRVQKVPFVPQNIAEKIPKTNPNPFLLEVFMLLFLPIPS